MNPSTTTTTTDHVRDSWDRLAPGFDRYTTPLTLEMGEAALGRLGLEPGMSLLDVAAGSGALAIPAARRGARVMAVDIAPAMIARLRERAREEGLAQLDARVMDGHALDLPDDGFDLSASMNGVSLFPDLQRGLREMVRVTRPQGRVMIVAFGPLPSVAFVNLFLGALPAAIPGFGGLPGDPPPLPFQVAAPATLQLRMSEAGLSDVDVETLDWAMEFESPAHYWDAITSSNPIAAKLLSGLTEAQVGEVRRVVASRLLERSGGEQIVLHNQLNIGIGTK